MKNIRDYFYNPTDKECVYFPPSNYIFGTTNWRKAFCSNLVKINKDNTTINISLTDFVVFHENILDEIYLYTRGLMLIERIHKVNIRERNENKHLFERIRKFFGL